MTLGAASECRITSVSRAFGILALLLTLVYPTVGQVVPVPQKWVGNWSLDTRKSTFGPILFPGVPVDLTVVSQTLRIEQTRGKLRLSGDTVVRLSGEPVTSHDDTSLSLDGSETIVGSASLALRRIDDSTFEIISKLNIKNKEYQELSRFTFSTDGKALTETKTQTEREVAFRGGDSAQGAVIRSSTSVLVFSKLS
jgi:hypothetical protein